MRIQVYVTMILEDLTSHCIHKTLGVFPWPSPFSITPRQQGLIDSYVYGINFSFLNSCTETFLSHYKKLLLINQIRPLFQHPSQNFLSSLGECSIIHPHSHKVNICLTFSMQPYLRFDILIGHPMWHKNRKLYTLTTLHAYIFNSMNFIG